MKNLDQRILPFRGIPLGLIAILTVITLGLFGLLFLIVMKFLVINASIINEFSYLQLITAFFLLLIILIGLSKRNYTIYKLTLVALAYPLFSTLYFLMEAISIANTKPIFFDVISLLIISIILVYIVLRKDYFKLPLQSFEWTKRGKMVEIIFFSMFILLWLIYFLGSFIFR